MNKLQIAKNMLSVDGMDCPVCCGIIEIEVDRCGSCNGHGHSETHIGGWSYTYDNCIECEGCGYFAVKMVCSNYDCEIEFPDLDPAERIPYKYIEVSKKGC
jgi:hypothetical protein